MFSVGNHRRSFPCISPPPPSPPTIAQRSPACLDLLRHAVAFLEASREANRDPSLPAEQVGLSPETLRRSNLDGLAEGDRVNLERALAVNGRNSGHFVQGHVDDVGTILSMEQDQDSLWVKVWIVLFVFSVAWRTCSVAGGARRSQRVERLAQ